MLKKVALITLGCAKNQVDSEFMLGSLIDNGYTIVSNEEKADAIVINTCCFISEAKEETVNTILEVVRLKTIKPETKLIVVGCAAQKYGQELHKEIPEIDAFLGTGHLNKLGEVLALLNKNSHETIIHVENRHEEPKEVKTFRKGTSNPTAYLKIADGCNNSCSYCVIPSIKGPYLSRSVNSLVREANYLVEQGVKELCLVAQDITAYGLDLYKELKLPYLIKELAQIKDLKWIRLLYCYPTYITDELINTIKEEPKVCRYLDIPLQHASNNVLKRMGRKGNIEFIKNLLDKIRSEIPDICLRTTFIVGFPGETKEEHEELLAFIKEQSFQ